MRLTTLWLALLIWLLSGCPLKAQYDDADSTYRRWFAGTSFFVFVGNLDQENPPNFVQLNLGYRLSPKDVLTLGAITWKYAWPNGIHPFFNNAYKKPEEKFPGYVREFGIAASYARFLWEGLFAELTVMPTYQVFVNESGEKIDDGFQIFNSYRVGYHINLFNDLMFIQPSVCITHRAYHTELPDGFRQLDDKWSKFIVGEPGLNIGVNF